MLKRTIATGIALAAVLAVSACDRDDETAIVDTAAPFGTTVDTTTLGVPTTPPPVVDTTPPVGDTLTPRVP